VLQNPSPRHEKDACVQGRTGVACAPRTNQKMTAKIRQKITPFLWFDDKAEEAARFYTSIFKNSKVGKITRYDEEAAGPTGRPAGSVMTVDFELEGQEFVALNGGPMFRFTEAISFVVNCQSQEEVDYFWKKLAAGGEESRCGWLKDKFGLSWQIVPTVLTEMLADKDTAKAKRVMRAMLQMDKIDIPALKKAYDQK
jgi:predicted 3-demethylubiquinone-9 3-methyltransferase (glyoxalase superfamily)